ncbi:hypothetical protein VTJ49DRAFT_5528 [Mycothermus thermophilus]|uniref:Uncharacterized protein n=1 Tax=Humicola insolens TaxID=85995 RepID=A0ABR3V334_HUMIN
MSSQHQPSQQKGTAQSTSLVKKLGLGRGTAPVAGATKGGSNRNVTGGARDDDTSQAGRGPPLMTAAESAEARREAWRRTGEDGRMTTGGEGGAGVEHRDDAELMRSLNAKVPEKRTAQITSGLPSSVSGNKNTARTALPPTPHTPSATGQASNPPRSGNISQQKPKAQRQPTTRQRADIPHGLTLPDSTADTSHVQHRDQPSSRPQRSLNPPARAQAPPLRPPTPPPPPREAVYAIDALGPDRTAITYVIYRTKPFLPAPPTSHDDDQAAQEEAADIEDDTSSSASDSDRHNNYHPHRRHREPKKKLPPVCITRCNEYASLDAANARAAALHDSP